MVTTKTQPRPAPTVRFGSDHGNHLAFEARHAYPETADPADRDSLDVQVELASGGFRASFQAWFSVADLKRLGEDLAHLHDRLTGEVVFSAQEDQLCLRLVGDGRGHIFLIGTVLDRPGSTNRLDFRFEIDQTELRETLVGLDDLLQRDGPSWADLCAGATRLGRV